MCYYHIIFAKPPFTKPPLCELPILVALNLADLRLEEEDVPDVVGLRSYVR